MPDQLEKKDITEIVEAGLKETTGKWDAKLKDEFEAKKADFIKEIEEKGYTSKEDVEIAVKAATKEMQDQFDDFATKANKPETKGAVIPLHKQIKEKAEALKAIAQGGKGEIEFKATSNRASITGNEQAFDLPDIGQLATRRLSIYDIFPKLSVGTNNNGVIRYYDWDEATIVRAAAMIAESGAFPESTAKFKKYSIDIKKIGDTIAVTDEFFEDEQMFAAELQMFLETNVKLEEDSQLANGDGLANNLTGLVASIDAYVAAAQSLQDASIYDLVVKVNEDISVTGGAKYQTDVMLAPQSVINKYKLKKDANNNYVIPPFVSRDGNVIDGLTVIECNVLAANTLIIGDRRFGRIYEKTGYEVSADRVASQFLTDEMTLKVRKRLAFLIRNADKGGFRKVTDVDAALTTLASAPI